MSTNKMVLDTTDFISTHSSNLETVNGEEHSVLAIANSDSHFSVVRNDLNVLGRLDDSGVMSGKEKNWDFPSDVVLKKEM